MPSPENSSRCLPARLVLILEIRSLLVAPSLWVMLIIVSLLVGYSFFQALDLFSKASQTALSFPEMASGMNPLDGIFVPTFGAYYLSQTLLLPFVAIRLVGLDKQSGALKLLLQLPVSVFMLCGMKIMAMGIVWLFSLIPAISALIVWNSLGGHIYLPEIALLIGGHGLYSLTIITIAMFAATITDSLPTAAMFCLAVTLGSWVLDFAATGQGGVLGMIGDFSLTVMLQQFEIGLFTLNSLISFLAIALLFFLLTIIWLHPGQQISYRIRASLATLVLVAIAVYTSILIPQYMDVTENRRHSFNPADTRALASLQKPLLITVYLDAQDSRLLDMEQDILAKLRRSVPKLKVEYIQSEQAGLFDASENDKYGLILYEYNGQQKQSYSNSQKEILPIIYTLAGVQVKQDSMPIYRGYPLMAVATKAKWWFYIILPLCFICAGIYGRKGRI